MKLIFFGFFVFREAVDLSVVRSKPPQLLMCLAIWKGHESLQQSSVKFRRGTELNVDGMTYLNLAIAGCCFFLVFFP